MTDPTMEMMSDPMQPLRLEKKTNIDKEAMRDAANHDVGTPTSSILMHASVP